MSGTNSGLILALYVYCKLNPHFRVTSRFCLKLLILSKMNRITKKKNDKDQDILEEIIGKNILV